MARRATATIKRLTSRRPLGPVLRRPETVKRLRSLTARQAEVLELVARGYRTREIAGALAISERAVTALITRLMAQFRVPNRSGLIGVVMTAAGFGIPRPKRAPLTHLGAQAHLASLTEEDREQYIDAPFLVAVTRGPDHIFSFVNRMWEQVMGLSSVQVIGRSVREVFPDAPRPSYDARERAFREGRATTGQDWHFKWATTDGTVRETDFRYIYQPLRTAEGAVEGLLLIATEAARLTSSRGGYIVTTTLPLARPSST